MAFDPERIHYGVDGETYGPIPLAELRALLREGRVGPDDYLWDEEREEWYALRRYPFLFLPPPAGLTDEVDDAPAPFDLEPVAEDDPKAAAAVWRAREGLPYAGLGIRFVAWILDDIVLTIPTMILLLVVQSLTDVDLVQVLTSPWTGAELTTSESEILWKFQLGVLALRGAYWSLMESSRWQATVGKRIAGLVVTDDQGYRLGLGRALQRFAGRLLCEATFGLGYALVMFTQRHQGLHDLVARTVVVRTR